MLTHTLAFMRRHRALILIILLGFALRAWLISINTFDPRFSDADDGDYYRRALRFAVTGAYVDDAWLIRPPLHVFLFAGMLKLALLLGNPLLGVPLIQWAQVGIALATIPVGYDLAARLFRSRWAGLLFAGFLAVWYPFVEQPTVLFSELLYQSLFLVHFWLLVRYDASGRLRDLIGAGAVLGLAALTRSPALYSLAFVVVWLALRPASQQQVSGIWHWLKARPWWAIARSAAVVVLACLAIVLPWTARNYLVYGKLIPVDTLGQINIWLDFDRVELRTAHIEELRQLPQAERAEYAVARAREILTEDPLRPFRNVWPTFRHVWKAQFVEDAFVKQSFFGRQLRPVLPLGLAGDLIWLVLTGAGLVALVGRPREGWHNRAFVLLWLGYALFTVVIFHVEPRYLLPIWLLVALYGAGALARWRERARPSVLQWAVLAAYVVLLVSYRNYPQILATGLGREQAMRTAERAYHAGDYATAERAYARASELQPIFVDAKVGQALSLGALGRPADGLALLDPGASRQAGAVAGVLARATGDAGAASELLARAETVAGESIQQWLLRWWVATPRQSVGVGDVADLGYIAGFSGAEQDTNGPFRWLEGAGDVVLPLTSPLRIDSAVVVRLSNPRPEPVSVTVRINGAAPLTVTVAPGGWRLYHLPVPPAGVGAERLHLHLSAPTFIPAALAPDTTDARALSVMVSQVAVQ